MLLIPHLARPLCALIVLFIMVLVTGGLHEDGLADCADAFGGGWTREDKLRILKDSRIGSFGAIALILSLTGRVLLLATMPAGAVVGYMIPAQVLARCTPLPLSALLKPARELEGQGRRVAGATSWLTVALGTAIAIAFTIFILRASAWQPIIAVAIVTGASALYYARRLG